MYPDVSLFYPVSLYAPQSQGTEGPARAHGSGRPGAADRRRGTPGPASCGREAACPVRLFSASEQPFASNLCTLRL